MKEAHGAKDKQALIFPGIVVAWADKDTALGAAGEAKGKIQVTFQFKGKVAKVEKAHVFARQFAKIKDLKEAEGKWTCELEDFADAVCETVAAYQDKFKAAAAALAAAAGAAADAGKDKPMEDPKPADDAMAGAM